MDPQDIFVVALLTLLGFVLGGGVSMVILVRRHLRARRKLLGTEEQTELAQEFSRFSIAPYNPLHNFKSNFQSLSRTLLTTQNN